MSIEAAIAWEVCASIHQEYAKGKDGLFTTRQADFIKHADDARMKAEWQGLTDDDVHELTKNVIAFKSDVVKFIREAVAKLREKNT